MEDFSKREGHKASFQQVRISKDGLMRDLVKDQVFVYFIGMDEDAGVFHHAPQLFDVLRPQDGARRVVRRVEQDHPCPGGDPATDFIPVDMIVGEPKIDPYRYGAIDLDIGDIAVVGRFEDNHFVAGPKHGGQSGIDGIGAAGGDGDLGSWIDLGAVQAGNLFRQHFPQTGQPVHVDVLVIPFAHGLIDQGDQFFAHREIGEALSEVDGAQFCGQ